jgi:hypothetical protein
MLAESIYLCADENGKGSRSQQALLVSNQKKNVIRDCLVEKRLMRSLKRVCTRCMKKVQ